MGDSIDKTTERKGHNVPLQHHRWEKLDALRSDYTEATGDMVASIPKVIDFLVEFYQKNKGAGDA